jgi:hypothetical protein
MIFAAAMLVAASPAFAIILHNDNQPTDRPTDAAVGRWKGGPGSNASCVMIAPNYAITTRHQYGGVGQTIEVGGQSVQVAEVWTNGTTDLRVVRLAYANGAPLNLTAGQYVSVYTGRDESTTSKSIVMGGFGMGRGSNLYSTVGNKLYGYTWSGTTNDTERWGTNLVDSTVNNYSISGYTSDILVAHFDAPGSTTYEAGVAAWDSGGGWFHKQEDGTWAVVGLSEYTAHASISQSWFANSTNGSSNPDEMGAVRVSSYASWITSTARFYSVIGGDANWDGTVDVTDLGLLATNYGIATGGTWAKGDFNGDGKVDVVDLGLMATNYGQSGTVAAGFDYSNVPDYSTGDASMLVPEPVSLIVLAAGGAGLLRRR